ncbi:calcium homeostasis modulator protein 6-like [Scomber scombrus]|uniref:Calcium homeostasis modulator protein 6-like n=1 Tax=Scomber scombrus TaxID=13677 RepID=A0AAV1NTK1_SCOSC
MMANLAEEALQDILDSATLRQGNQVVKAPSTTMKGNEVTQRENMMPAERHLMARLSVGLRNSPVGSNVVFFFLLAAVEKMLQVDFACPCNPLWNAVFVAPFFLIPALIASLLMWLIHGDSEKENEHENKNENEHKNKNENENKDENVNENTNENKNKNESENKNEHKNKKEKEKEKEIKNKIKNKINKIIFSILPSIVWMALMLVNGRYIVCAFSTWPGRFVADDTTTYLKWCRPTNTTIYSSEELLTHSHRLYIVSQGLGNVVVAVLLCFLFGYIYCKAKGNCCKTADNERRHQNQEEAIDEFMMTAEANLIGRLKDEFGDNPVVSNVVFAFLLALVEKIYSISADVADSWSQ